MNPGHFFAELKRRNVYKVAIAYAAVAWLLIQLASILFPTFEAPAWVMKVFIVAVAAGFPIALVIAWAFELTPEGLKRTDETAREERQPPARRRRFAIVIAALAMAAAGLLAFRILQPKQSKEARELEKTIAVLPFANFNRDPEHAYFADGVQDEILTRLAKIEDLKVISRTSTQRYKSSPDNLPEIAKQLGVAHVLEGSVQKAGDQVRVTVQLIRAATDVHIWAETYDRKLTDIFAVQTDIAENIAKALRAKLSPGEQKAVAAKPTDNPAAYDAYLRGIAVWYDLSLAPENLRKMEDSFSEAVRLDPDFAIAWAHLSTVHTLTYAEQEPTAQRLAEAKRALDTAFKLQPDGGEVHFALGLYRYRTLHDYDGALRAFEDAIERGVNRSMSLEFSAYVKRRQGKWDDALALLTRTTEIDPRNPIIFSEQAVTLRGLRRFAEAHAAIDRALVIAPESTVLFGQKAAVYLAEGNLEAAGKWLERVPLNPREPDTVAHRFRYWMFLRRFDDALQEVTHALAADSLPKQVAARYRARRGFVKRLRGDLDGGNADLAQARAEFEALREQSAKGEGFLDEIIFVAALLGDRRAVEAYAPMLQDEIATDGFYGPSIEETIAAARAQLGETESAVSIISGLLQKPGENALTKAVLRYDPVWDPLRHETRFLQLTAAAQDADAVRQQLVAGGEQTTPDK